MSKKNNTGIPKQGVLFDAQEMYRIEEGTFWSEKKAMPVTVLGHTFQSDDERREWFRAELRKKLPELRKIEGFPIGSDDDIIRLSDPPYYTACPNPWLNDFIDEWEKEKVQLEKEGKRKDDVEVNEPYASDVSEGKNNSIYMAHSYHTKVPHPAIMRYILHYTQPGDIVFDGFAGTGMTGVAANLCGSKSEVEKLKETYVKVGVRHGICSDLSPIATLIAASYNLPFDAKFFETKANAILDQVEKELGWMYETEVDVNAGNKVKRVKAKVNYTIWSDVFTCPSCGQDIVLWNVAVSLKDNIIRSSFPCPHCGFECSKKNMEKVWETSYDSVIGETVSMNKKVPVRVNYTSQKRGEKDAEQFDIDLVNNIDYPKDENYGTKKIPEGVKTTETIRSNGIRWTHQFYTKRNFIYLSRVWELAKENHLPLAWVTSVLQNASKMYKFRLDRKGGILNGTLFVPSLNIEQNPYNLLKSKIKDFSATGYPERGNSVISLNSATQLNAISNNSVDYMFIDPPFGANIMYSELSSIWEGWIKVMTNNTDEAIVNSSQHKNLFDYQALMNRSLKEFYRILKPGKWLTLEFSNTSASVWNSIQNALQGVGFVVANVASLDKKQGSYNAVTSTTAVKQDLVISCYKPSDDFTKKIEESMDVRQNVWDFISEHLQHLAVHVERGNATTTVIERNPKILYDRLISYYVQHGYSIPMDAQEFQQGLRDRFIERDGMFFNADQVVEYDEKKSHSSGFVSMGIIISDEAEGIQWLKNFLRVKPKTYQEIQPEWMQAINGVRKGDILPELREILEENFIEMDDGKWRIPNVHDGTDKEVLRTKTLIREFKSYVEQAKLPKGKLSQVRLEALREGFKQCYINKDFKTIVVVGDKLPQDLRDSDPTVSQFYEIALNKV